MIILIILVILGLISVVISLFIVSMIIYHKLMDWTVGEKIAVISLCLIPIINLINIYYGYKYIYNYFNNIKNIKKENNIKKEQEVFKMLDKINVKYIERYLRNKKLKKIG